ncbi:Glutathione S-transferase [Candidatus Nitrotoga sp. HW29]|uniref:glutathione S-transferase n=1 Tax=Candidatus Nitrotoga sp. HW29 TaxID=2886963 RepID=UPI001EF32875|nr:glutathione S-transferase N-terminal domain-containing protein [Candidatus Nitrotoga sp. HW29]CAH1904202.1 Glutathione S-transferase [Candidatus Nitrotoga sp. HW29]
MELYGSYTSPFVRHCRIALLESGMQFAFVETDATSSAKLSPTKKMPFLKYIEGGKETMLTDSSAILKSIREQSGKVFFSNNDDFNDYCTANTLLDTAINLFYLEKEDITPAKSAYLTRQQSRMASGLTELNKLTFSKTAPFTDSELRIACLLDWAVFRNRITLDAYLNLKTFLDNVRNYPHFASTAPK